MWRSLQYFILSLVELYHAVLIVSNSLLLQPPLIFFFFSKPRSFFFTFSISWARKYLVLWICVKLLHFNGVELQVQFNEVELQVLHVFRYTFYSLKVNFHPRQTVQLSVILVVTYWRTEYNVAIKQPRDILQVLNRSTPPLQFARYVPDIEEERN